MRSLLSIYLLIWTVTLFGQSNDSITLFDSLVDRSMNLRFAGDLDSALQIAKRIHAFPKKNISDELRIKHISNFAFLQKDKNKAIAYLDNELLYQGTKGNHENIAKILYAKGNNYFESFNDRDALINYIKADSIFEQYNIDTYLLVMSKVGIVNVLMKSNFETDAEKFDQAALYIDQGIRLADSIDFPVGSSILLEKKGHYLQLNDQLEESLEVHRWALKVSQSIDYRLRESSIYDGMAKVFFKQNKIDSASFYFEKHLELIEMTAHAMDIAEANYNVGQFYNQVGNFQMAKGHLIKARNIFEELPNVRKEYPYIIQNELAITYSGLNETKKAFTSLSIAKKLQDEIYSIRNSENIRELETQYRTEKKEQEIALLKSKNELAEQQKKSQRNFLLGGLGITSIAFILLFVMFKNRQRTNKKLREIDALKTNFFTNISHEFRTPLTLISAPIQETLEEPDLTEEKRNHLEIAQKSTKKLSSLVDQLLELSKIDSGNRTLILEKNTPTQLIAAWSESFLYLADQKEIDFKTEISNKEVESWFDREALENIVVNLLGNAIKYTPQMGSIDLKSTLQDKKLNIVVGNSGQGLTKPQINTIFNRFFQTDAHSEGAGVGLSLVKELVELHKGSITVESTPDKWTEFKVSLCVDKGKLGNVTLKDPTTHQPNPSAQSTKIEDSGEIGSLNGEHPIMLIVEDNADVRMLLTDTFKTAYTVIQANDGEAGIAKALEKVPDIIVSDLMMPIKDGIELTKTLKEDERTSHIPIILLTAKAGDENELTGIKVGADDYITKPFNQKILKSKAASLISLRKKLQSRYSQEVVLKPKDISITPVDERFLTKVQKVLDENLVESSFTVEEFSQAVNMSRMQLHRKLKALTGLSASEFMRSQRLKLAAQILKQSDINVSEVGYSVGFNDHAYFSKCFKEVFRSTPTEFASKK